MKRHTVHLSAEEQALIESLLKRKANSAEPRQEFRDELYGRLVRSYVHQQSANEPHAGRGTFSLHAIFRFWAVTAVVLLSVAGTGLTTAYAYVSPSVTRASNLYFLKRTVENLELLASSSPEQRSRLHLKLANRRLEEATVLTGQGTVDQETLEEIVSNTRQAEALASRVPDSRTQIALNTYIASETNRQRTNLVSLVRQLESETSGMSLLPPSEQPASEAPPETASASSASDGSLLVASSASSSVSPAGITSSQPVAVAPSPAVSDASTVGALEKTIANIGKVEMSAASTAMKVSQETGFTQSAPQRLPDLFVSLEPGSDVREGESFSLGVRIANVGQRGAPNARLLVAWGDGNVEESTIIALDRDEDNSSNLEHIYRNPGTYIIRVQIDPKGLLSELTTANNRETTSIEVTPIPRDTCPGDGIRRCVGQDLQICRYVGGAEALSWDTFKTCAGSATCTVDGCKEASVCPSVCTAGQKRCLGKNVQQCTQLQDGCVGWEDMKTCYGSQYCSDGECRSSVCGNGTRESLEECDDGNTSGGDGCSSGCLIENETCSDTDAGRVIATRGTVRLSRGGETRTDSCRSTQSLEEFYCEGAMYQSYVYDCVNGCRDGACLSQTQPACGNGKTESGEECDDGNNFDGDGCTITCLAEQCSDSDGGEDRFVAGTARYGVRGSKTGQDTCRDGYFVTEHYCYGNGHAAIDSSCQFGCRDGACLRQAAPVCSNGKVEEGEECDDGNVESGDGCSSTCRKEAVPPVTCTDSDGGIVPAQKGTTSIVKTGGGVSATDYCDNSGQLREYYCTGDASFATVTSTCQYGCKDGTCLSQPVAVCGNGKVEAEEQCDDGNTVSGDGCSSTCLKEIPTPQSKAFSFADANNDKSISPAETASALIRFGMAYNTTDTVADFDRTGWVDFGDYSYLTPVFGVTNQAVVRAFKYVDTNGDMKITDSEAAAGAIRLDADIKSGNLRADFNSNGVTNLSELATINVLYGAISYKAACGNGLLDLLEQCDDGNATGGDGCSATCRNELGCGNGNLENVPASTATRLTAASITSYLSGIRSTLDIDNNGAFDALSDGILVQRYFSGIRGTALIDGAIGNGATRTNAVEIEGQLSQNAQSLDIDGNGQTTGSEDGVLILRYLFGFTGEALVGEECDDGNTINGDGCSALCLQDIR
ncbi:MAG: DUF4215 domain-containing protein [Candidatus Peribacteraceae bacterium]|nr:DUF4215 domain-containing protein [Candidatus Peribacteraceae bacterium]